MKMTTLRGSEVAAELVCEQAPEMQSKSVVKEVTAVVKDAGGSSMDVAVTADGLNYNDLARGARQDWALGGADDSHYS